MNSENEHGQLVDERGVVLREKHIEVPELLARLDAMTESRAAREAATVIRRFQRLLLPVYMGVAEDAMADEAIPDAAPIFSFSGSGTGDQTYLAEFRSLVGDERKALEEYTVEGMNEAPPPPINAEVGGHAGVLPLNTQIEADAAFSIWLNGMGIAVDLNHPFYQYFMTKCAEHQRKFEV